MKKSTYLCCLVSLCLFFNASAQSLNATKSSETTYSIGDTVPDIILGKMLNNQDEAYLSDFTADLLILDFWATWCAPCINMMPKADSLSKQFYDRVRFLPVTYEKGAVVENLFGRLDKLEGLQPPMIIEDAKLRAMFPHRTLPHYVWLDGNRIIRAITGIEGITAGNIKKMLESSGASIREKREKVIPFKKEELLLVENTGIPEKPVLYQSALLGYMEGVPGIYSFGAGDSSYYRVFATNVNLLTLYRMAYSNESLVMTRNRTYLEVSDTSRFTSALVGADYGAWMASGNGYSYELIVPSGLAYRAKDLMQRDLKLYFPQYNGSIEERHTEVLALVRTSGKDKLKSAGGEPAQDISFTGVYLRNMSLGHLVAHLKYKYLSLLDTPVIDETGYKGGVDLKLTVNPGNLRDLRQALHAYDLDLVKKKQIIKVLVIRDNDAFDISH